MTNKREETWMVSAYSRNEHQITRKITNWMPTLLNRPKGIPKGGGWMVYGKI
jgi:hypothetical protein